LFGETEEIPQKPQNNFSSSFFRTFSFSSYFTNLNFSWLPKLSESNKLIRPRNSSAQ